MRVGARIRSVRFGLRLGAWLRWYDRSGIGVDSPDDRLFFTSHWDPIQEGE